jgi:choline dehydrogenase-like flavoprotein
LEGGVPVKLLDAGITLEAERASLIGEMRQSAPDTWTSDQVARIKEGMSSSTKGIPLKLVFGSDFPYRDCDRHAAADFDGVGLRASLARGGLSNVWGAAMMPYVDRDLQGWPFRAAELAEHYATVLRFTGLSGRHDDLEPIFPLYFQNGAALEPSQQGRAILQRLTRWKEQLSRAGIVFGQSRLSVRVAEQKGTSGCVYCGLCMYGCPYGHIYNSADTLYQLQARPGFSYQPDVIVTRLREMPDRVIVEGYQRLSGQPFVGEARRVYLAAGVLPTTQILLRSDSAYDRPLSLVDSQYFLLPLAMVRGVGNVQTEALNTLCQIFLEITDPAISPYTVHLQVYTYNDLIGQALRKTVGPFARLLEDRLIVVQGYLHSVHSALLEVRLSKSGGTDRLRVTAHPNLDTRAIVRRIMRKLLRHSRHLGAVPVAPLLQIAQPGRGFHSGGSFPMRTNPGPFESDVWGRPHGWRRVHAVDATVLPTIPATTITFSVMANAHRIGAHAATLDS